MTTPPSTPATAASPSTADPWWTAALVVGGCEAIGFLSGWVGGVYKHNPWIDDTRKPALWPPTGVFPVAWATVNYPSLGIASWLVWRRRHTTPVAGALRLFGAQLVLNASFLPLVYRVKTRRLYVVMDVVGAVLTTATTLSYGRVARPGGAAILPYLAWTYFTTLIKVLWWRMDREP